MAEHKDRYRKGISNDLEPNDPDFDRDKKIPHEFESEEASKVVYGIKKKDTVKRDSWLIAITMLILFLWYFDWNPINGIGKIGSSVGGLFGNKDKAEVVQAGNPEGVHDEAASGFAFLDYVDAVNELSFEEQPTTDDIKTLYNNGVPVSYMQALDDLDYLNELSATAIIALYANGVPTDYFNALDDLDYLGELSYSSIIALYANGVTTDYLKTLDDLDYLDEVSYSGIIGMYANGVTIDYLKELDRRGLLEDMSYSDVISMYLSN